MSSSMPLSTPRIAMHKLGLRATSSSTAQTPALSQPRLKRKAYDGTAARPLVVDSDFDKEDVLAVAKQGQDAQVQQRDVEMAEKSSEDDEPLIKRFKKASGTATLPVIVPASSPATRAPLKVPVSAHHASGAASEATGYPVAAAQANTPSSYPLPSQPLISHYGERTNLSSAFKSARNAAGETLTSSPAAARVSPHTPYKSYIHRRVATPERLFTNMRLHDVNKLILSMPKVQAEEAKRSARKKKAEESLKRKSRSKGSAVKKIGSAARKLATGAKSGRAVKRAQAGAEVKKVESAKSGVVGDRIDRMADLTCNDVEMVDGLTDDRGGKAEAAADAATDADDEDSSGIDIDVDGWAGNDSVDYDSDVTLAAESLNDHAASPLAARKARLGGVVVQRRDQPTPVNANVARPIGFYHTSVQKPRFVCTTRSHSPERIIESIEEDPFAAPPSGQKPPPAPSRFQDVAASRDGAPPSPSPSLMTSPLTKGLPIAAANHPSTTNELPTTTAERETAFLSAFKARWWPAGFSMRAAIAEVNAVLRPNTRRFSQIEGERRLRALAGQGRLVVRNDLVYHPGEAPHVEVNKNAPVVVKTAESIKSKGKGKEKMEVVEPEMRAESAAKAKESITLPPTDITTPIKTPRQLMPNTPSSASSPYGKISSPRYRAFSNQLYAAVKSDALFANSRKEETLFKCVAEVNEWMGRERLSVKEVGAAFVHMAKKGRVELKGNMVKLVGSI